MLTPADRKILAIERQLWIYPGPKESAIRERTGLSATRFYQALSHLLDDPEALAFDPLTVRRLRRLRERRQLSRRTSVRA